MVTDRTAISRILLVIALLIFALAAFGVSFGLQMVPLGLAVVTAAWLVP
jgi:hypothetical protein